jgi:hypothetical protein
VKGGNTLARQDYSEAELLKLVVEEFDEARDAFQLASQLAPHLPIRSLEELVKATEGKLQFRDVVFDPASFETQIPEMAFPIVDLPGLVQRVGYLIRIVPPHLAVDPNSESGVRRRLKNVGQLTAGIGLVQQRGLTAMAVSTQVTPSATVSEFDRPSR